MIDRFMQWVSKHILLAPLMILLLLVTYGCGSVQYVPVETVKTDSIYLNKLLRDSIFVHDSIFVRDKGDTVFQYKYKYIYRDRAVHDTTYIERIDTLRVPYPVEKELTKWQRIKMDSGGIALAVGFVLILIVFGKMVYKLKK